MIAAPPWRRSRVLPYLQRGEALISSRAHKEAGVQRTTPITVRQVDHDSPSRQLKTLSNFQLRLLCPLQPCLLVPSWGFLFSTEP